MKIINFAPEKKLAPMKEYIAPRAEILIVKTELPCMSNETQKDGGESDWDEI